MYSDQSKVIMIKDDQEEDQCNRQIYYLRSQRICERNARQCRQCCEVCQNHGDQRLKREHVSIKVQKFREFFHNLQASCSRQTEHYIRQMNEAQNKARQEIRRKKLEYFKQIQEVKTHMMKKTYRTLEEKYTNLYEKYKNQRFQLLKCCQVFWVMNALPSGHSIKHSEINKKLEGILKKFQNFKQVARNLPNENMFNNKEKVKKTKISQKIGAPQVRKDPVYLQKVSYDTELEERYKRAIARQAQQLQQLKTQKKQKQRQLDQLEIQLRNRLKKMDFLKSKLSFQLNNINIKYPDPEEVITSNLRPDLAQNQNQNEKMANEIQLPKENKFKEIQTFMKSNHIPTSSQTNQRQQTIDNKADTAMINEEDQQNESQEKHSQLDAQNDFFSNFFKTNQSNGKVPLIPQKEVKIEPEQQPYIEWGNKQLVQEIRRYGKNISEGLKVQEIDRLRSFDYVPAPQTTIRINSNLLKKPQSLARSENFATPEKKATDFTILASSLFQKHEMKKQLQADKSLKKPDPAKQT